MSFFKEVTKQLKRDGMLDQLPAPVSFSTGITLLDLHNATYDNQTGRFAEGIGEGRMMTLIGKSGTAKTTLALQVASSICRNSKGELYSGAGILHIDAERATRKIRVMNILGITEEELEEFYVINDGDNIHVQGVYETINAITTEKRKQAKSIMITVKDKLQDKEVEVMTPTVIILDTLAMLMPEKVLENDEVGGNMVGSQTAMLNNKMLKGLSGRLASTNTHLIIVNHITDKISTNMYEPVKAMINFLKPNESVPGGTAAYYLSDYYLRLEAGGRLESDKDYGIKGFKVKVTVIKSRGQPAGHQFTLIYDQTTGYSNELSNYEYMKDMKLIQTGTRSFLKSLPDVKFTQKTFLKVMRKSLELRKAYRKEVRSMMKNFVSRYFNEEEDVG